MVASEHILLEPDFYSERHSRFKARIDPAICSNLGSGMTVVLSDLNEVGVVKSINSTEQVLKMESRLFPNPANEKISISGLNDMVSRSRSTLTELKLILEISNSFGAIVQKNTIFVGPI